MNQKLLVLMLLIPVWVYAQDIEVKKFETMEKDQTALLNPRKDINGITCGLVKVNLKESGLTFQGNIVGEVESSGTDYYVYLARGCKRINIKHPDYMPTTVVFSDYGISKIESGKTYYLELKAKKVRLTNTSKKKGLLVINLIPSDAELYIDDNLIPKESGGVYTLNISQGNHYYSVKYGDFSINNRIATVSKKPNMLDVNLTEFFASVSVNCSRSNAEIYINDVKKGEGYWKGYVPPGNIVVEVRKKGYHPQSRSMQISENDNVSLDFRNFKMLSGRLYVSYKPDSSNVYVDGLKMGVTPLKIDDISIGEHQLKVTNPYYKDYNEIISINEGQDLNISGQLDFRDSFSRIWVKAHEGDVSSQYQLAQCYMYDRSWISGWTRSMVNPKQAVYWYEKAALQGSRSAQCMMSYFYMNGKYVERDYNKSFRWAKQAADQEDSYGCYYLGFIYANGLGFPAKDEKQAVYWLRRSILLNKDNDDAKNLLKKLGYELEIP